MILLVELQYFPPVTLISALVKNTHIVFDIYDNYEKMSFRNRCVVAGSNGPINLSIPLLEGRNQRKPLKEVRIDNRRHWQRQHWRTIFSCYNRSPWFEFYRDELEQLFLQQHEFLADWNLACWNWLIRKLELKIVTELTGSYRELYEEGYLDWRNKLMPGTLLQEFPEPVRYSQVFQDRLGFLPHLSVLDLLFCEGKRSISLLATSKLPT